MLEQYFIDERHQEFTKILLCWSVAEGVVGDQCVVNSQIDEMEGELLIPLDRPTLSLVRGKNLIDVVHGTHFNVVKKD